MTDFDVIVIGAGPGGYTAAIRAAQLGAKVALIEKDTLGGTCLNRGCMPTKALIHSADLFAKIKNASSFGIEVANATLNWQKAMEHKQKVVSRLVKGVEYLVKQNKIELIKGTGKLIEKGIVEVNAKTISGKSIVLAMGSEPARVAPFVVDHEHILDSTDTLNLKELPKSVAIIGGGVMGVEFASLFANAGVAVSIIEMLPHLLPEEDQDISKQLEYSFKKKKIEVLLGHKTKEVQIKSGEIQIVFEDGTSITKEKVVLTIGRALNTKDLEETGIKLNNGKVVVNKKMQTNLPGVYAIGDITGIKLVAHVAMAQAKVAAEAALGFEKSMDYKAVPCCIWSSPEIATVGLSEQKAIELYGEANFKAGKFPFQASGKAQAAGEAEGFVKVIINRDDNKLIGVHIIGPNAANLITEATLALNLGVKTSEIIDTIHAHPTLGEAFAEAIEATENKAIHTI